MRHRLTLMVLTAAFCGISVAPAGATELGPTLTQALEIAQAEWHPSPSSPCHGQLTAQYAWWVQAHGHDDETRADWDCTIYLAPRLANRPGRRCDVILHAGRHYAGWTHPDGETAERQAVCHPRPTLTQAIREDLLPGRAQEAWTIRCSPPAARRRCTATRPGARNVRRYVATAVRVNGETDYDIEEPR